ncbi:MAG: thiamine-phosphate kinase [Gammaproteobacteria bacterium]
MPSEVDLIEILRTHAGAVRTDVVLGIGDDAAVVQPRAGHDLVLCTDTLVAGVHFPTDTPAEAIGHKALAVNLSDLAAMGAEPTWALLCLTLPEPDADWVRSFASGLGALAERFGVQLIGGDTTRGPLSITVQLAGEVPTGGALRRGTAKAGDALFVSGPIGDAALALTILQRGDLVPAALRERLDRPEPCIELGLSLRGIATAAIDVSDGLLTDLARLLHGTGFGATVDVESLPRSAAFVAGGGVAGMQLYGGDDYELLFAAPADAGFGVRIGTVEATPGIVCVDRAGRPLVIDGKGYDAFR